ncbi:MAG: ABC transporter ATP-binding protein [Elusimicrobia bacterium]|nr:ABC transporter ATP-binding protein [Elusimicrobiota bacterium]
MNVYSKLLPYLRPYRFRFVQAVVAMVVVAASQAILVLMIDYMVNRLMGAASPPNPVSLRVREAAHVVAAHLGPLGDAAHRLRSAAAADAAPLVWVFIVGFLTLVIARSIAAYIQNYLMSWLGQRITQDLREELFRYIHVLGLDFLAENKSGDILARVTNDLNTLQSTLNFTPLYLIRDSLSVIWLLGTLFFLNPRFAAFALLLIPLVSGIMVVLGRKMRESSRQSQTLMGLIYSRFQESLQGMLVIKAYNYEEGAIEKFREENASFFDQMMRYLRATALSGPLMELIGAMILSVFVYFVHREIAAQHMTPGDAAAFLFAFIAASMPIKNLGKLQSEIQRGLASGERIFQLLNEKPNVVPDPAARKFTGLKREIRIEGLTFGYQGREKPALKDVDLVLRLGERVAIVGPSGSGKSTLVQLLLRLYDPERGRILFDGEDLRELDVKSVREQIGLVTQDTVLFNDTVLQNVSLGRRVVTMSEVEKAAKIADADRFIAELPHGYRTALGDRGVKLSGGQRQRLAITRAVLKNPSILILDEATSHLDSASEESVQAALDRLMEKRTSLVIAHRLSTVSDADRICVLNQGEIVEQGTHRQLLARDGLYRKLYEIQQSQPAAEDVAS